MIADPFILDWLNLLSRFGHMIAGIAWIGTSFYFVALDYSLRKIEGQPAGVLGEAWEVHGGGFYSIQKYATAPPSLPDHLTWVTGFILLIVQYYFNAESFLIDPEVMVLTPWQAIGISVGSLIAGWLIYTTLCKTFAISRPALLIILVLALIMCAAYGFTHVFSGRGAFIHVGVFIGTLMAANVFMVIIPNQRKIVTSLVKGEKPDPRYGMEGKQRSLHNTYLTLPVLVMMISNHYAFLTSHPQSWILIGLIVVGGAALRHYLLRTEVGDEQAVLAWLLPIIGGALILLMLLTMPRGPVVFQGEVSDSEALSLTQTHCASCHAAQPKDPSIKQAPKNIMLENLDDLRRHNMQVVVQAVSGRAMPMGNKTGMTAEDRAKLGAWLAKQP